MGWNSFFFLGLMVGAIAMGLAAVIICHGRLRKTWHMGLHRGYLAGRQSERLEAQRETMRHEWRADIVFPAERRRIRVFNPDREEIVG
jgi:hypothetical protein